MKLLSTALIALLACTPLFANNLTTAHDEEGGAAADRDEGVASGSCWRNPSNSSNVTVDGNAHGMNGMTVTVTDNQTGNSESAEGSAAPGGTGNMIDSPAINPNGNSGDWEWRVNGNKMQYKHKDWADTPSNWKNGIEGDCPDDDRTQGTPQDGGQPDQEDDEETENATWISAIDLSSIIELFGAGVDYPPADPGRSAHNDEMKGEEPTSLPVIWSGNGPGQWPILVPAVPVSPYSDRFDSGTTPTVMASDAVIWTF